MFHRHDREWKLRPLLLAALLALALAIPASEHPETAVATKAGEWRTLTLEDGSVATLGPRTVLTYSFSPDRRSIHLTGGEALFKVKKDPARPFVVATPVGCAKALGTIFSVSHRLRTTAVTTQEGIVATAHLDRADPNCSRQSIRLFAGQKAVIESWTPMVARTVETSIEHAWTRREIIFTGQTVEQALSEFNRRNWVQLDVPEGAEILQMRLFGRFPLDNPERFARYLEKQLRWRTAHPKRAPNLAESVSGTPFGCLPELSPTKLYSRAAGFGQYRPLHNTGRRRERSHQRLHHSAYSDDGWARDHHHAGAGRPSNHHPAFC